RGRDGFMRHTRNGGLFARGARPDLELFVKTLCVTMPVALSLPSSKVGAYLLPVPFPTLWMIASAAQDMLADPGALARVVEPLAPEPDPVRARFARGSVRRVGPVLRPYAPVVGRPGDPGRPAPSPAVRTFRAARSLSIGV